MSGADQYLLALYIAEHRFEPPIPSGRVADLLDRSPAAATEMLQRLEADGLVAREPYAGATLTDDGRERATELHESYVLLSWFFREVLDLDAHEREAMEIAGLVSPAVTDRLVHVLSVDADVSSDDPTLSSSRTE